MSIKIFKQEVLDGLEKTIASEKSVAFYSEAHITENPSKSITETNRAFAKLYDKEGLYPIDSLLATIGWNKNDDVFLPEYTWAARNTPIDKPFNFQHNEKDIIGHITSSVVIDKNNNIINDNTDFENVPDFFHVVVASVLYKKWEDEELQERMDKTIAEIKDGKWFVSMECLFRNFDYCLDDGSEKKVIARNEESSFLTKHLRRYGGSGVWDGRKIGRVLRSFAFSGKGLVSTPANEQSIIFKQKTKLFNFTTANITQGSNMPDINERVLAELSEKLEKSEAEKANLRKEITESLKSAHASEVKSLSEELSSVKEKLEAKASESVLQNEKFVEVEKELSTAKAEVASLKDIVEQIKKEKVLASRISQLLNINVGLEEATKIAERWSVASDEQFNDIVSFKAEANKLATEQSQASENKDVNDLEEELESAEAGSNSDISDLNSDENLEDALSKAAAEWLQPILNKGV